jgi:hypothetical protein
MPMMMTIDDLRLEIYIIPMTLASPIRVKLGTPKSGNVAALIVGNKSVDKRPIDKYDKTV